MSEKITVTFEIDTSKLDPNKIWNYEDGAFWTSPMVPTFTKNGYRITNLNAAAFVKKITYPTPAKFGNIESEVFKPRKSAQDSRYSIIITRVGNDVYLLADFNESSRSYLRYRGVDPFSTINSTEEGLNRYLTKLGYSREERREIFKRWFTTSKEVEVKSPKVFETKTRNWNLRFEEVFYNEDFIAKWQPKLFRGKLIEGRRGVMLTAETNSGAKLNAFSMCNPVDKFDFLEGIKAAMTSPLITSGSKCFTLPGYGGVYEEVVQNYIAKYGGSGK